MDEAGHFDGKHVPPNVGFDIFFAIRPARVFAEPTCVIVKLAFVSSSHSTVPFAS
jgi:hypothetical protein